MGANLSPIFLMELTFLTPFSIFPNYLQTIYILIFEKTRQNNLYSTYNASIYHIFFRISGNFLRRIGCQPVTNFPNGIDISDAGDILVGDSHGNQFHVAVYDRRGDLVSQFQCPQVNNRVFIRQCLAKYGPFC